MIEERRLTASLDRQVFRVNRTINSVPIAVIANAGFASVAYDMEIDFSLQYVHLYLGGGLYQTLTVPGYSDIANLFQEWKLEYVEVQCIFSNNVAQVTNTLALPVLMVAVDYQDVNTTSLTQILQYENLRIFQLGNQRGDTSGFILRIKPRPLVTVGASSSGAMGPTNIWLNTDVPSVQHLGLKCFLDTVVASANTVGYIEFYFKMHYAARKPN
jgi:hypothetical protein